MSDPNRDVLLSTDRPGFPGSSRTRNLCYFCAAIWLLMLLPCVIPTNRYYGTYTVFGTGDTIISTTQAHFGPEHGKRRWNVECLDGEAVIGIGDLQDDFQKLVQVWCKFMFPYKEYTNGMYPYYPDCFVNNYTYQFYCYSPKFHDASVNSFITGFWDNDGAFFNFRPVADDKSPYKCCKTPPNYFIDYPSCYYMPTRDQYGEYYDATNIILTYCATGYAMAGLAKKLSPFTKDYHIEWIQCCRIGFGALPTYRIPHPAKTDHTYDSYANVSYPSRPSSAYASQYSGNNLGTRGIQREPASSYSNGDPNSDLDTPYRDMPMTMKDFTTRPIIARPVAAARTFEEEHASGLSPNQPNLDSM